VVVNPAQVRAFRKGESASEPETDFRIDAGVIAHFARGPPTLSRPRCPTEANPVAGRVLVSRRRQIVAMIGGPSGPATSLGTRRGTVNHHGPPCDHQSWPTVADCLKQMGPSYFGRRRHATALSRCHRRRRKSPLHGRAHIAVLAARPMSSAHSLWRRSRVEILHPAGEVA